MAIISQRKDAVLKIKIDKKGDLDMLTDQANSRNTEKW